MQILELLGLWKVWSGEISPIARSFGDSPIPPSINSPSDLPDPRYQAGIAFFNAGDFFEAHEVWEDLWHECEPADRRFFQSLIQAAVALYHSGRGNAEGADRLLARGRQKSRDYPMIYRGLNLVTFWNAVAAAVAGTAPPPRIELLPPSPEEPAHD